MGWQLRVKEKAKAKRDVVAKREKVVAALTRLPTSVPRTRRATVWRRMGPPIAKRAKAKGMIRGPILKLRPRQKQVSHKR